MFWECRRLSHRPIVRIALPFRPRRSRRHRVHVEIVCPWWVSFRNLPEAGWPRPHIARGTPQSRASVRRAHRENSRIEGQPVTRFSYAGTSPRRWATVAASTRLPRRQLAEDARDVCPRRLLAHEKSPSDLTVGPAVGQKPEHLQLPPRQPVHAGEGAFGLRRRRLPPSRSSRAHAASAFA